MNEKATNKENPLMKITRNFRSTILALAVACSAACGAAEPAKPAAAENPGKGEPRERRRCANLDITMVPPSYRSKNHTFADSAQQFAEFPRQQSRRLPGFLLKEQLTAIVGAAQVEAQRSLG